MLCWYNLENALESRYKHAIIIIIIIKSGAKFFSDENFQILSGKFNVIRICSSGN
jgi:hypothetical protein